MTMAPKTSGSQDSRSVPVSVAKVTRGPIDRIARLSGELVPALEVNVVPKAQGRVAKVNVDVGSSVSKGEVLIVIDATELESQLRQAEAGAEVARRSLELLEAGRFGYHSNGSYRGSMHCGRR